MLSQAPEVQPLDWKEPFHIFVDASDIAIGSALMQKTPPNWYRPVYYASSRLSTTKRNYSTMEREATKFRHYLLGRKFTFHVDHSALLYLVNKQALTGWLARWMLLLQEFDFEIQHRPGVQHAIADYLSRLDTREPPDQEYGDLTDTALFSIDTTPIDSDPNNTWITEMTQFLSTGLPPDHLTIDARKWLAIRSRNFCLFTNMLYHKASDGIWRRAVQQFEKDIVFREAHHRIVGGHYVGDTTTRKI